MAYREFHVEKIYEAPDVGILERGLNKAADNISGMFMSIAAAKRRKDLAADQYKVDLGQGSFENDNKLLYEMANSLTEEGKQRMKSGQGFDSDYNSRLNTGLMLKGNSKIQYDRFKATDADIEKRAAQDKYFNPNFAKEVWRRANYGDGKETNEVNFFTRGERQDVAEKTMFDDPRAFKIHEYTADYVKNFGDVSKEVTTGNPNASNTRYNKRTFWNRRTGAPGVTDEHAIEYLKSRPDGSVQRYIENEVNSDLDQEIDTMKGMKDPRTDWMKGLSDVEIKNEIIRDPSKNVINSTDFGVRVRDKAKRNLEEADNINTKVSSETKTDRAKTGGLYNNDSIAHSDTFYNEDIGDKSMAPIPTDNPSDAYRNTGRMNSAPGGILMINKGTTTGKPIQFESNSTSVFNINSGSLQKVRGSSSFNMTGYQVQAYDREGRPFLISGSNPAEFKKAISEIPYSQMMNLDPDMKIALKGYSLNKGKMLGDVRTSMYNLNEELGKATAAGDEEKKARIETQLESLKEFQANLNLDSDEFTEEDIMMAAAANNITAIRTDQLVRASKADMDKINTITEGLNLNDKNKWSVDMTDVADQFKKRYNEAAAAGFKDAPTKRTRAKTTPKTETTIPIVSSDAEYQQLPSGAEYVGPDGVKRRKK